MDENEKNINMEKKAEINFESINEINDILLQYNR